MKILKEQVLTFETFNQMFSEDKQLLKNLETAKRKCDSFEPVVYPKAIIVVEDCFAVAVQYYETKEIVVIKNVVVPFDSRGVYLAQFITNQTRFIGDYMKMR